MACSGTVGAFNYLVWKNVRLNQAPKQNDYKLVSDWINTGYDCRLYEELKSSSAVNQSIKNQAYHGNILLILVLTCDENNIPLLLPVKSVPKKVQTIKQQL